MRRRLLDAAGTVFLEVGYANARLTDVARVAGLTKGAVYSNFDSKLDLFADVVRGHTVDLANRALAAIADGESIPRAMAAQLVTESRWSVLITEFGLHALRRPELGEAYAQVRTAQRDALTAALTTAAAEDPRLAERIGDRPDHAALLVLAAVNGLAIDHRADPAGVGIEEITGALAVLLAGHGRTS